MNQLAELTIFVSHNFPRKHSLWNRKPQTNKGTEYVQEQVQLKRFIHLLQERLRIS